MNQSDRCCSVSCLPCGSVMEQLIFKRCVIGFHSEDRIRVTCGFAGLSATIVFKALIYVAS